MHRVPHLLSFYALSFEAAVPGSRGKMFLCELLRKGKGTGRAGPEALQRAGVPGRYLQPLPGRTGRVGAAVLARRFPHSCVGLALCLLLGSQDCCLNLGSISQSCEEF